MDDALFFKGGSKWFNGNRLENMLKDFLDVAFYRKLKSRFEKSTERDMSFVSNEQFWQHIISNKGHVGQYIELSKFRITEWLPMSPGLYHTHDAIRNRRRASEYIIRDDYSQHIRDLPGIGDGPISKSDLIKHRVAVELNPHGKMSMVLGGIGSLRLGPKKLIDSNEVFLLGATSNGVCHEGIPIVVPYDVYQKIIAQLKEHSSIECSIVGRLQLLPTESIIVQYDRMVPKYYVFVEEFKNIKNSQSNDIIVSVAITYSRSLRSLRDKEWSFVSFNPDEKDKQLLYSVEWLHDYARRYSGVDDPIVMSDFDEHRQHFNKTDFPIKDIANGMISLDKLSQYAELFDFNITVMGDYFNNIKDSTIINKSIVEGAFNKVKERNGEDIAIVISEIANLIRESNNREAGEIFEEFSKELQTPAPRKSILMSFWNTITTIIPTILSSVGIVEKVMKIIE